MGITEDLFNAARECLTRQSSPGAKQKLGWVRARALQAGIKPEQIQTVEVAALKAAKLQATFGKKRAP